MTTWTVETVQALIPALEIDGAHQTASALTWALGRYTNSEVLRRALSKELAERALELDNALAERDAANARAESARVDALEEAANKVPSNWLHPAMKRIPSGRPITCDDIERCLQDVAASIRALREAGK